MTILAESEPQLRSVTRMAAALPDRLHGTARILNVPAGPMNNVPLAGLGGAAGSEPVVRTDPDRRRDLARKAITSVHTHGTPPLAKGA